MEQHAQILDALQTLGDSAGAVIRGLPPRYRPPTEEELFRLTRLLRKELEAALDALALSPPSVCFQKPDLSPLFGESWEGSPFNGPPLFWWKPPGERDVTEMIGLFCSEPYSGKKAALRRRCFLDALKDILPEGAMPEYESGYAQNMRVIAEERVPAKSGGEKGKENADDTQDTEHTKKQREARIDLFFRHPAMPEKAPDAEFYYAIEAKFTASLDNPVGPYIEHVRGHYPTGKEPDRKTLVLILGLHEPRRDLPPENFCFFASWWKLLPAWEKRIAEANDRDENFSRFRMSIWSKIGGLDVIAQHRNPTGKLQGFSSM